MRSREDALLSWWRRLAFVGHYTGADALVADETNRILRYHSVGGGFYDNISPEYFREQLAYLTDAYDVVDLPDVLDRSDEKRVALTFDDGYRDFYDHVLPALREYEVPATVFVIADAVENPDFTHNGRFDYEYMTGAQLRELVDEELVTVGNHTVTHPRLTELSRDRLEREIVAGKQRLEELLGTDVSRFCYPFGDFDERAATVVRETHDFGTVSRGRFEGITPGTDPATIPRINGAEPSFEFRWNLSDAATRVGRLGHRVLSLR
jgi:peptidoglycan/xylan/chitin deacetylase (PgdA/CDA1 family)